MKRRSRLFQYISCQIYSNEFISLHDLIEPHKLQLYFDTQAIDNSLPAAISLLSKFLSSFPRNIVQEKDFSVLSNWVISHPKPIHSNILDSRRFIDIHNIRQPNRGGP